jgi:hypothetical protein
MQSLDPKSYTVVDECMHSTIIQNSKKKKALSFTMEPCKYHTHPCSEMPQKQYALFPEAKTQNNPRSFS